MKNDTQSPVTPLGSQGGMVGERQAALLVESALEILNQSHVKDNQWRLGALGNGDIEIVKRYLTSAKERLSNYKGQR